LDAVIDTAAQVSVINTDVLKTETKAIFIWNYISETSGNTAQKVDKPNTK